METVNGSHCFTIKGYSLTKGMEVGSHIASDIFTVGGHQWAIYFYPGGKYAGDGDRFISAYIVAFPKDGENVRALFDLRVVNQNPNSLVDQSATTRTRHYRRRYGASPQTLKYGEMWGFNRFWTQACLKKSRFLKNDTLSINCNVSVVVSGTVPSQESSSVSVPEPDLGEHLGTLLDSIEGGTIFGDVTFEIDGEIFQAHKLVLAARSPVFKSQFYGPMSCGSSGKIPVRGIAAPVFKAMLRFIYTDMFPDSTEFEATGSSSSPSTLLAQHLLVAADRYGLNRLKLLCEVKLCKNMSTDTVATTLTLADQHSASQLKAHCLKYATANIGAVMRSEGFNHLQNSCPSLEMELLRAALLERP